MLLKLDPLRASSCKLCRSAHTSDSNELPPDSKTPTTFHMRRPTFRSAPNAPWVLIHKQFADDDFIQSRRKHSTGDKAHFVMDVGAHGQHAANGKVVQGVAGGHKYLFGEFGRHERIAHAIAFDGR